MKYKIPTKPLILWGGWFKIRGVGLVNKLKHFINPRALAVGAIAASSIASPANAIQHDSQSAEDLLPAPQVTNLETYENNISPNRESKLRMSCKTQHEY